MPQAHYELQDAIAVIRFDNPPVNSLCLALRQSIAAALKRAYADDGVSAIVLNGIGKGFCAGGDLKEVGTPAVFTEPAIAAHLLPLIEAANKPVVAAIHGFALGGGLEIALACHYRLATPDAQIALPEVAVGLLPPSGSQRLPRLIGLEAATELILSAKRERADKFAGTPLFDLIVQGDLLAEALAFARRVVAEKRPLKLVRYLRIEHPDVGAFLQAARERAQAGPGPFPAAMRAIDAIAAAAQSSSFDEGMAIAKRLHDDLQALPETKALSSGFLASRAKN